MQLFLHSLPSLPDHAYMLLHCEQTFVTVSSVVRSLSCSCSFLETDRISISNGGPVSHLHAIAPIYHTPIVMMQAVEFEMWIEFRKYSTYVGVSMRTVDRNSEPIYSHFELSGSMYITVHAILLTLFM